MATVFTVQLEDGRVGTIRSDELDGQHPNNFIGEIIMVDMYDERLGVICYSGVMAETLYEREV